MKVYLIVARNFLYRLFFIGLIFSVLFQLIFIFNNFHGLAEAANILHVSQSYLIELLLNSISAVKTFLFFGVLCPALALHWTITKDKLLNKTDHSDIQ